MHEFPKICKWLNQRNLGFNFLYKLISKLTFCFQFISVYFHPLVKILIFTFDIIIFNIFPQLSFYFQSTCFICCRPLKHETKHLLPTYSYVCFTFLTQKFTIMFLLMLHTIFSFNFCTKGQLQYSRNCGNIEITRRKLCSQSTLKPHGVE